MGRVGVVRGIVRARDIPATLLEKRVWGSCAGGMQEARRLNAAIRLVLRVSAERHDGREPARARDPEAVWSAFRLVDEWTSDPATWR